MPEGYGSKEDSNSGKSITTLTANVKTIKEQLVYVSG